jgi:hypothetical protein
MVKGGSIPSHIAVGRRLILSPMAGRVFVVGSINVDLLVAADRSHVPVRPSSGGPPNSTTGQEREPGGGGPPVADHRSARREPYGFTEMLTLAVLFVVSGSPGDCSLAVAVFVSVPLAVGLSTTVRIP